jgi:hypothetical protein
MKRISSYLLPHGIIASLLYGLVMTFFLTAFFESSAQQTGYYIQLTDKNGSPYNLSTPEEFLSERAISRRIRQDIAIDISDIPVNPGYIEQIEECGAKIKHVSRWMNGVIILCDDANALELVKNLPFVQSVEKTREAVGQYKPSIRKDADQSNQLKSTLAISQLCLHSGGYIHQQGYTGHGMQIAILDAGFYDADNCQPLSHVFEEGRLLGTKDFVGDGTPFYKTSVHGTHVFSVMAAKTENWLTGSAPDAGYYLFRTEDQASEYPIEADFWICAAELADSLGADIIQSSLGYYYFDNAAMNYSPSMLDGSTRISRAAQMAVDKGIIVVNSAGNEALNQWKHIIMPADAPGVLSVGAVTSTGIRAQFSSVGYPYSPTTKPDVMAQGVATRVISYSNMQTTANGTSYSSPIIAGLTACLWMTSPNKKATEITDIIRRSSDRWAVPDLNYGYGIPDFKTSMQISTNHDITQNPPIGIYPNPFSDKITVAMPINGSIVNMKINAIDGRLVWSAQRAAACSITIQLPYFPPGMYILTVENDNFAWSRKIIRK